MQIAWLIAVIVGLATGGLLVGRRANGCSAQRGPSSPAGASRRFAPQRRRLAELISFRDRSISSLGYRLGMTLLIGIGLVAVLWLPARLVPAGAKLAEN